MDFAPTQGAALFGESVFVQVRLSVAGSSIAAESLPGVVFDALRVADAEIKIQIQENAMDDSVGVGPADN